MNVAQILSAPDHQSILARIGEEVRLVEEVLQAELDSNVELVREISRQTLSAGGKRLRPALVHLAASATGNPFNSHRARRLGACVEMIHMATLIHDDVIDHASTRRGKPTASSVYGNTASILSGDAILARSMMMLATDGDIEIIRTVSGAVVELAEGEVQELSVRGRLELSEQEHMEIMRRKTASLIGCCCEVGALVAGADDKTRQALKTFGFHLGIAFQVADDLLDYRGKTDATGKRKAGDFHEGQATLPLIYLRETLSEDEHSVVQRGFGNGVTDAEIDWIIRLMDERGAFSATEQAAQHHLNSSLAALDELPVSGDRKLLEAVAKFVVDRNH
jgi:octaprenyl-diphosphate synthase